jgi:hypothetical protein
VPRIADSEPDAVDALPFALPTPLLEALALRCLQHHPPEALARFLLQGPASADTAPRPQHLRWRRALQRALRAEGFDGVRCGKASTFATLDPPPSHVHRMESPRDSWNESEPFLVAVSPSHLAGLGKDAWLLTLEPGWTNARLFPAFPRRSLQHSGRYQPQRDTGALFALASYQRRSSHYAVFVRLFSSTGHVFEEHGRYAGRCPGVPQHFLLNPQGPKHKLWVVGSHFVCALPEGEAYAAEQHADCYSFDSRGLWSPQPLYDGNYFALPEFTPGQASRRLRLLQLADGQLETHETPDSHTPLWHQGALYGCSYQGLWKLTPGSGLSFEERTPCSGVAFEDGHCWLGGPARCDGVAIPGVPQTYDLALAPCGAVFFGMLDWHLCDRQRLLASSTLQGEFSAAYCSPELMALAAGAEVALVDEQGVRAHTRMPHDGAWLGASQQAFIYGNKAAGIEQPPCEDLVALSLDGLRREQLAWRGRWRWLRQTFYAGDSTSEHGGVDQEGVWLSNSQGELATWTPFALEREFEPLPQEVEVAPVQRVEGLVQRGFHTYNPRDDWPVAGWSGRACEAQLVDCVLGGTTGVAPAPDVELVDGASVLLQRCTLGQGQVRLRDHSVLFVLEPRGALSIDVDASSQVIVLE